MSDSVDLAALLLLSVPEVVAALPTLAPEQLAEMQTLESQGKNRKGVMDAIAAILTPAAADTAPTAEMPAKVVLLAPYGFYDEEDRPNFWQVNQVVEDPVEIAELVSRGAPVGEVGAEPAQ